MTTYRQHTRQTWTCQALRNNNLIENTITDAQRSVKTDTDTQVWVKQNYRLIKWHHSRALAKLVQLTSPESHGCKINKYIGSLVEDRFVNFPYAYCLKCLATVQSYAIICIPE